MDCHSDDTVDLCSEPECLKATAPMKERKDLTTPHKPSHGMLKVHRILFNRDTGRAEKNAKDALEVARETLSDLKAQKKPMPQCVHCKEPVSQPCWYCVDCTRESWSAIIVSIITPFNNLSLQRRGSSATTASINVSHSTRSTPRSTSSSGSSRRWSKRSSRQRIDYEPSRDSSNPFKIDFRRWRPCSRNSCQRTVRMAP